MSADAEKALDRIRLMLPRTTKSGASEAEVDAAARHIGRLVMKFPELLSGFSPWTERRTTETWTGSHDWPGDSETVTLNHSGKRGESPKSVLFIIRGNKEWIPKAQLVSYSLTTVTMSEWIARQKGLI